MLLPNYTHCVLTCSWAVVGGGDSELHVVVVAANIHFDLVAWRHVHL
jgi:hypothetical protein